MPRFDDVVFSRLQANLRSPASDSSTGTPVNRTRVVLFVEPGRFSQTLHRQLESEFDLDVVGETSNPADLLLITSQSDAHAVITVLPESNDAHTVGNHLLIEVSHLLAVGICPDADHGVLYRKSDQTNYLPGASIRDVLQAIQMANVNRR